MAPGRFLNEAVGPCSILQNLTLMNARLHTVLRYLYALVIAGSEAKYLYNIYSSAASSMATGYPEPEA